MIGWPITFSIKQLSCKLMVLALGLLIVSCGEQDSPPKSETKAVVKVTADLVLKNAKIYTLNWPDPDEDGQPSAYAPYNQKGWHPDATTIAISEGKIIYVGDGDELTSLIDESTQQLDLQGATVIPGLVDSHVHVAELGEILRRVNLIDVQTPQQAIERAKVFETQLSQGEWLIGQGWDEGAWATNYPNRQLLDAAFPDRPVVFKSLHGFAIWTNSKALQMIGINEKSQAPVGGEIVLDEQFNPTGIFLNNATNLIKDGIPKTTAAEFEQFIADGLAKMARDGYVSVHQAGAATEHMNAFEKLRAENRLPIRVYAMLSARDKSLADKWVKKGPYTDPQGWLDIRSVKAYYDGALGSRGARLLEPYSDLPDHKGVSGDGYGFDGEIVKELMKSGFQVGIHAIGDAGNRETLDYLQSVYNEYPLAKNNRHRIEHAQVISEQDIPRLAKMSIVASMEPPHAVEDKTWAETRLGSDRIKGAYAWRSLRQANVALTFNSDLPGSDHNIFYGLHSAITRQDKNSQPENGWYPEQSMTAEEALRGYTIWATYSAFREEQTGVLANGRWADITVLDIDPLQVGETQPQKLLDGKVLMTIVNGKIVYQSQK
ncbi:MAG: amidohydrolase [Kangiellaceae bacterium]|nr:amidohydrolase [Kangiellaceae bacterium]